MIFIISCSTAEQSFKKAAYILLFLFTESFYFKYILLFSNFLFAFSMQDFYFANQLLVLLVGKESE